MNFFQQLAQQGNVDLTLRIMEKNGKLTVMVTPGVTSSGIPPMNFTGTPEEMDAEFFTKIAPEVKEVAGIISNIEDVKNEAGKKLDESKKEPAAKSASKPASKKAEPKKADKKATKKSTKPQPVEADLFEELKQDADPGEEDTTTEE